MSFACRSIGVITTLTPFSFNYTITGTEYNFNVRQKALAAGWNGVAPLHAHILITSPAGKLGSTDTSVAAFDTDEGFPPDSSLWLEFTEVPGFYLVGKGGDAGKIPAITGINHAVAGEPGGVALRARYPLSVYLGGNVIGGGGGGAASFCLVDNGGHDGEATSGGGGGAGLKGGKGQDSWRWDKADEEYHPTSVGFDGGIDSGGDGAYGAGKGGDLGMAGGGVTISSPTGTISAPGGAAGVAVVGNSFITWVSGGDIRGEVLP